MKDANVLSLALSLSLLLTPICKQTIWIMDEEREPKV